MYMSVVAMQPDNLQRLQRQNGIHQRLRSLREDSGTIHSHVQIDKDIQGDIPGLAKSRDRTGIYMTRSYRYVTKERMQRTP